MHSNPSFNWGVAVYVKGVGITRNYIQAYVWFSRALAQGQRDSIASRSLLATYVISQQQLAEAEVLAHGLRTKK